MPRVLFHAAFVAPGTVRRIAGAWLGFFTPASHPWNHDDRALIAAAGPELAHALP